MNPRNNQELLDQQASAAAWNAHIAYVTNLYASTARGYGSGNTYEYHGPEVMGSDGKSHREQRIK